MMNLSRFAFIVCLFALIQGCASEAIRDSKLVRPQSLGAYELQSVQLTLSPDVQGQLYYNENIKPGRVLGAMKRNLQARQMLGKPSDRHLPTLEIVIHDIRARSEGAAQWFGFLAGEDRIVGEVVVRDSSGKQIDRVSVKSSYAWGGPTGTDYMRMNYLYDSFAERAAELLTGRSLPRETLDRIASSQV